MKISTIRFSYLRNEAHYQFLLLVKKLFEAYPSVANIVSSLLTPFYTLLALECKLVDAVASIPDQPYNNKPVTPMPEATFDGHDLSYHDNNAPGTASATIHGKGAFKGKKTVSFNIVGS